MPECRFETVSPRVDRFSPDARTDRPVLGAIRGTAGTLIVDGGASPAHLGAFAAELAAHDRPPIIGIALTHWHWDHSFGSAALDVPVVAGERTAAGVAVQAAYDWSDEALEQRVRDGLELAFSLPHIREELPDRSALRIVVPQVTFAETHRVDLGDTTVELRWVGGDHADDSVVIWEPEDRVLFLGDALYQCLWGDPPFLTIAGTRSLLDRLAPFDAAFALEGHDEDIADAAAYATRLDDLRRACDLVEQHGGDALRLAPDHGGEWFVENVEHLLNAPTFAEGGGGAGV
jgi:glyoxylase-like metal-dependent hydrolase (beta-lactamase superfamily II)